MVGTRERPDREERAPARVRGRPRAGAARLSHDLFVLALSAAESARLRDALARGHVVVDVSAPDDIVRVPAPANPELGLRTLLALVSRWAEEAGVHAVPIAYRRSSYVLGMGDDVARGPRSGTERRPRWQSQRSSS